MTTVSLSVDGPIATLRLENEAKYNALTPSMPSALTAHCDMLEATPGLRAVILTGAGEKAEGVAAFAEKRAPKFGD